jgi:hypothetical protein
MRSALFRIAAVFALLGSALVLPAIASAQQQPTAIVITLLDGTQCRGRTGEAPFSAVDVRANYECIDGRWGYGRTV